MYISELKLWNFRKYGNNHFDLSTPHLIVPLAKGMNILIGENDSGKSAIIDAIKLVLKTNAYESIRVQHDDFYDESDRLRIELLIDGMSVEEAKNFIEISMPPTNPHDCAKLKLILDVSRKEGRILPYEIRGGYDSAGRTLDPIMKENLRSTYLKPLRDAETEMTARKNSRLSQILQSHELLKQKGGESDHELVRIIRQANKDIEEWFNDDKEGNDSHKKQIKGVIDDFLNLFISDDVESKFYLSDPTMRNILERIAIGIVDSKNLGLGTLNRLFMATELLHLRKRGDNLKVCLIEELEAHIHPQAQMKVITALQKENNVQFILTTHSPNITSKVKLGGSDNVNNILLCKNNNVFPMGQGFTMLEKKDYEYLDTFLDVTKSNLFFAKGIILVEGWAEEILIPAIASKINIDLTQKEVSIVNVGSTAYLHFARIFMRKDDLQMNVKCSIVTDLDVRPDDADKEKKKKNKQESINNSLGRLPVNVNMYIAKEWTLEWCLFKSSVLSSLFKDSVAEVHSKTTEFKKDDVTHQYKDDFETKLIEKLKDRSLDKTAIALTLSSKIENTTLDFSQQDDYIKYLLDAIRFVS